MTPKDDLSDKLFTEWFFPSLRGAVSQYHDEHEIPAEQRAKDLAFFTDPSAVGIGFRMLIFVEEKARLSKSAIPGAADNSIGFILDGFAKGLPTLVSPREGKITSGNALTDTDADRLFSSEWITVGEPLWWLNARNSYLLFLEKCREQNSSKVIKCKVEWKRLSRSFCFSCYHLL